MDRLILSCFVCVDIISNDFERKVYFGIIKIFVDE